VCCWDGHAWNSLSAPAVREGAGYLTTAEEKAARDERDRLMMAKLGEMMNLPTLKSAA